MQENKNKHSVQSRLPRLSQKQIFLMTFGYFGTQIAFAMQTGTMGRIFQTIGADPNRLGFFFILPPLAGLVTQPLVDYFSDKTWHPRYGRRMPYLILGSLVAMVVMFLLPNAGSFGFGFGSKEALIFAAIAVLFIDLACNVAQQPFKMIIPDMANEEQSQTLWSLQNVWGSLGALTAFGAPFLLTAIGLSNTAKVGEVPQSVRVSFYLAALILGLSTFFTVKTVKEYSPEEMARYRKKANAKRDVVKTSFWLTLKGAPQSFWRLGIAAFFVWMAIPYMWTYSTGALAETIWQTTDPSSAAYQAAGNWFGLLQAVYCAVAIVFGLLFTKLSKKVRRPVYTIALLLGAIGFFLIAIGHSQALSILAFVLFGIAWIAIITIPFTILTNALDGEHNGALLGFYNCFICIPQMIASSLSFLILPALGGSMAKMFYLCAFFFVIGAFSIWLVKDER
ncbi:SLC45 family MFS transporter [Fructobacillus papyrifericola]|uniref:SLC45 family MFS transporter n=1 Tax=Fructobacillus papyrifericola TaxID=2713172 RepID=A0ABS5QSB5_9LACO|nr:SLC45 family MFS transporter [Fructobacillus papyrifericola]MBS9336030.1 SLC45 family MFS transporter [Fructobacillus papyrifericola]